jgi:small subunit ribosomal protein S4
MARFRGPLLKICRRYDSEPLFGNQKCQKIKKKYPAGEHGLASKRKKVSEYGQQLKEKQKLKFIYGVLERQFRNYYKKSARLKGVTGEVLIELLESRLDNVVYRLGLAPSRRAARQLVNHGHVLVNGHKVDIASYSVSVDDEVQIREKSRKMALIHDSIQRISDSALLPWLTLDKANLSGKMIDKPIRREIPEKVNEQLIVELYSK